VTDPLVEKIAQNVLTTLQTIVAGVTVGTTAYNYTIAAQRHSRDGDKRAHLNAILVQADPRAVVPAPIPNTLEWRQPFHCGVYIIPAEGDATPIDQYLNRAIADVQKAIMVDRYRGGLALDTQIVAPSIVTNDELKFDIAVVQFEVHYRTAEVDGYVNAF
jgi:hypothetical protein